jgi:hypothetical protein
MRPGCPSTARLIGPGRERARQNIVDVRRHDQTIDRQAHARRYVAGIDVAEIAGGNCEGEFARRRAERDRGGEIIDHLGHDPCPIDRIDAGEPGLFAKSMLAEHSLYDRLAIVEGALDRNGADIGGAAGRHHAALHVGNAPLREQDDEVDLPAIAKRLDSRAPGVAGSGNDDGAPLAARGKRVIHQPRQELHRQIFECERRAVEKLEQKRVDAELAERRHGRMAKIAIGLAGEPREICGCD